MTKTQKKELKNRFFKILHIVSYALSIIFIIVLIVSMVQSCGNSKKTDVTSSQPNNALPMLSEPKRAPVTNDNNYYNYVLLYNYWDDAFFSLSEQYDMGLLEVNLTTSYNEAQPQKSVILYQFNETDEYAYFLNEDGTYSNLATITAYFNTYLSNDNNYYYRLSSVAVDTQEGGYGEDILTKKVYQTSTIGSADDYIYKFQDEAFYVILDNASRFHNVGLKLLYSLDVGMNNYTFASQINYYGAFGSTPSSQILSDATGIDTYSISTPTFVVSGKVYNGIKLYYEDAQGKVFGGSDDIVNNPTGTYPFTNHKTYMKMTYLSAIDDSELLVNVRDMGTWTDDNGNIVQYYKPSSSWINFSYQYIRFGFSLDSNVLEKLNQINQDYSGNGTIVYGDYNVFTLISSAFEGWLPLLGVTLLPGITIGTLLFLPLVVIVIFAIIKVVKK